MAISHSYKLGLENPTTEHTKGTFLISFRQTENVTKCDDAVKQQFRKMSPGCCEWINKAGIAVPDFTTVGTEPLPRQRAWESSYTLPNPQIQKNTADTMGKC